MKIRIRNEIKSKRKIKIRTEGVRGMESYSYSSS